jgi:crotonobetainyl-CoA:carnitine CoA-transferase CaiB-like acyl-CoA transferase
MNSIISRTPAYQERPLQGVRVIELSNFVSGPLATMMLGDLGADVVKVEPPSGDPMRKFGRSGAALSPLYVNSNRGKRGMVIDLKETAGRTELLALLESADILVSNWRPSVAPRLGLADDQLTARNPRLIRIYLTGFGTEGPRADTPVYDAVVQAHLGSAQSSPPTIAPSYIIDKTAATVVVQAALAALYARERSGLADRIDLSLLDAASYVNFVDLMANRTFVDDQPQDAGYLQAGATRAIRASNGWLIVAPVTGKQVRRACDVVGRPDLAADVLSITDATKLTTRLLSGLEAVTLTGPVDRWVSAFVENDVPAGPCLTIDQHLADDQVAYNHLYDVIEWEGVGRVRCVRYPALFSRYGEFWPVGGPPARLAARAPVATPPRSSR